MKLFELNKLSFSLRMFDVNNSFANQSVLQMLMNFIEKMHVMNWKFWRNFMKER